MQYHQSFITAVAAELPPNVVCSEELETRLLMADVGVEATGRILAGVTERLGRKQLKDVQALDIPNIRLPWTE